MPNSITKFPRLSKQLGPRLWAWATAGALAGCLWCDASASAPRFIQNGPAPGPESADVSQDERAWQENMQQGQEALQQGNINRAIRSLETAADLAAETLKDPRRVALAASVLGDVYYAEDDALSAVDAYRRAIDALAQVVDPLHPAMGEPAVKLARALFVSNQIQEAQTWLNRAVICLKKAGRTKAPLLALSHLLKLQTWAALEDSSAAALAADEAIADLDGKLQDDAPFWGMVYNQKAFHLSQLTANDPSYFQKAVAGYQASVDWHVAHTEFNDESRTQAWLGLARAAHDAGQLDTAADAYLQAIEHLKSDQEQTVRLAYVYAALSAVHHDQHQRVAAIDAMYTSVDTLSQADDVEALNLLTASLTSDLRLADLAEQAVDVARAQLNAVAADAPGYSILEAELARALAHRGKPDDHAAAAVHFSAAADRLRAQGPEQHGAFVRAKNAHASMLIDTGRFAEAIDLIQATLDWAQQHAGDQAEQLVADLQPILITAYSLDGQSDRAVRQARRQLKQVGRLHGERSREAAHARARLADTLADVGDQQASLATYDEALALLAPLGDAAAGARAWIQFSYARELFNDGQYAKALPLVQAAFASDPQDYIAFYLACCHLKLGQPDAAEQTLADWAQARHPEPGLDWPLQILTMLRGEKTSDELAQMARQQGGDTQTRWLCELYFYLAMKNLSEGDDQAALKHLRACRDQNVYQFVEWESARRMLTRLEKP